MATVLINLITCATATQEILTIFTKMKMSNEINTNSLQRHYQDVLDECPEYSDPSSDQYDLAHCADLAQIRFQREADGFYDDN